MWTHPLPTGVVLIHDLVDVVGKLFYLFFEGLNVNVVKLGMAGVRLLAVCCAHHGWERAIRVHLEADQPVHAGRLDIGHDH